MRKKSRNGTTLSPLVNLLVGCGIAAGIFLLTTLLFSVLTFLLKDPSAVIPLLSLPAFLCAGLLGAVCLYSPGRANLRMASLSVLLFLLLLLLIGVLLCHGRVSAQILLYDLGYLAAFGGGCALRSLGKSKRRKHRF